MTVSFRVASWAVVVVGGGGGGGRGSFPAGGGGGGGGAAFLTTGMVALVFWGLLHLYQAAQIFIFRFKVLFFLFH